MDLTHVDEIVEKGIRDGVFPGAAYAVGFKGKVEIRAHGRYMYCPDSTAVTPETMWDMASCTKVVATTTAAMMMFDAGKLKLDQPVYEVIPQFKEGGPGKDRVTMRNLLLHNSGLPGGTNVHTADPWYTPEQVLEGIYSCKLRNLVGSDTIYSDLNMVMMQKVIEKLSGQGLDDLVDKRVWRVLGMKSTMYLPPDGVRSKCAPTEAIEPWRQRVRQERGIVFKPSGLRCHPDEHLYIQGEVHDPTAMMIGGVSGNAGLFSTAGDLSKFALMMLSAFKAGISGRMPVAKMETIKEWTRVQTEYSSRGLGWDTRSGEDSSSGHFFSMRSFGHTGFTGTSIWIDPEHDLFAILLGNRVHPMTEQPAKGKQLKISRIRPIFHDAVARACGIA